MIFKKLSLIICCLSVFFVSSVQSENELNQQKWLESCPNARLCFEHPQNLTSVKVQVIDSNAGQFRSDSMTLSYDLGWYASQFKELSNAVVEATIIDGKQSDILITDKIMALRIPSVEGKIRFSMQLDFSDQVNIEDGRRIFTSIKFLPIPVK